MNRKEEGRKKIREDKESEQREINVLGKVEKSQNTLFCYVFPLFCGSRGSKTRLLNVEGAEPPGQMGDEQIRRYGAKRMLKSKDEKRLGLRTPLEV